MTTEKTASIVAASDRNSKLEKIADDALEQLGRALEQGQSETLKQWLRSMSRFHRYSWTNVLLIAFQKPTATHVAGFNSWRNNFKRCVKKGEKGIMIMAPVTRKVGTEQDHPEDARTESRIVCVKPVYVFDVSQTEGEPLPEFAEVKGNPSIYAERLKNYVLSRGIALEYAYDLGGANGVSFGGRIKLLIGQSAAAEFSVLAHEFAHEMLHSRQRRAEASKTVLETEAEAVAFAVCTAIGLETSTASSDYIQLYRGEKATLAESLQAIRNVAAEIITGIQPPE